MTKGSSYLGILGTKILTTTVQQLKTRKKFENCYIYYDKQMEGLFSSTDLMYCTVAPISIWKNLHTQKK